MKNKNVNKYGCWFADVDLENNTDVQARLAEKELPTRIFYDINVGGGYSEFSLSLLQYKCTCQIVE